MSGGRASWHFGESESGALQIALRSFMERSGCHAAFLVDRSGQLISSGGDMRTVDPHSFASLAAADFSANEHLARLVGEDSFNTLFHQGEGESVYLGGVGDSLILAGVFARDTQAGLVRLRGREAVERITDILERARSAVSEEQRGILAGAEDEIDQLFR